MDWLVEARPSFSPPRRDLRPADSDPGATQYYSQRLDNLNTKYDRLLEQLSQRLKTAIEVNGSDGLVSNPGDPFPFLEGSLRGGDVRVYFSLRLSTSLAGVRLEVFNCFVIAKRGSSSANEFLRFRFLQVKPSFQMQIRTSTSLWYHCISPSIICACVYLYLYYCICYRSEWPAVDILLN